MAKEVTEEELLAKAAKPGQEAMKLHPFYKGKLAVIPKCAIRTVEDFAIWYTPGVAAPCRDIQAHPETVFEHTNKGNLVAIVSDGSRVLGLGDIGPEAAMPVMEGKAILFKYLGGVDAFPICLDTKDPDEIIQAVKWLEPTFGGVNLEDLAQPKCFYILDTLRKEARIPVWHDDQQGTAAVTLAALINALKVVGKEMGQVKLAMIGAGAANIAITRILMAAGVDPEKVVMVDSQGTLHAGRTDLKEKFKEKWHVCQATNAEKIKGGIPEALKNADVCIALSKPGPGTIKKEWIRAMAKDAVVFVCANPIPEIWPWEAKEAGARVVATGRSDFANQVNNSLGFPGIFRGTLDVRATTITDEMCIAAAQELARCAEDKGISEDYVIPTMEEWEVYPREAVAVAKKAMEQGVARLKVPEKELYENALSLIKRSRDQIQILMKEGLIPLPPEI
ncbi:malate dehydrogenase (oxaloacetate-decarboxylating) [Candidatus Hakubella thermalkaliphila]|uniref:Malate dehydrogenase (Oxaloacetate-decarboxylating) n=1 Tax=Candidatus Hakubella thermalkaliphila TaxID=2754717 RepID=A0A6V8NJL7_9ACTN|nr:NADP-dependent malic enzyme [Candidatus Hakubella thermalkaliphila]GFP19561.1 malate dehydrogenase (oxaloacetate-decarboxylating) [Candidatus Hakubella thermalkaliphila]GFP29737.1 malate dehydrogenase (oxaloacetate-decarboxylating) [Candidatus Hakubella thermalkaliphila]GFP40415.1 malate dehydrogenase (oxaloacetate-decarboxylating) [Candidatus Hakubella thermalkaliphila]GFP42607.1 malate dehydrogenase (oxaloacetate-decarboxylating) [Candidatus Hakubella thermalkaliphila]